MQVIAALVIGIIFGLGILLSGMGNPVKRSEERRVGKECA